MEASAEVIHHRVRCPSCRHVFVAELPKATIVDDDTTFKGDIIAVGNEDDLPSVEIISGPPGPSTPNKPNVDVGNIDDITQALGAPRRRGRRSRSSRKSESVDALTRMAREHAVETEGMQPAARPLPAAPLDSPGGSPTQEAAGGQAPAPKPGDDAWYVRTNTGEAGPLSKKRLARAVEKGLIGPRSAVRHASEHQWIPAEQVPGLFDIAKVIPEAQPSLDAPATRDADSLWMVALQTLFS